MKKVAILGSTGSIGTQTLQVIGNSNGELAVHSLVAYSNATLLGQQIEKYKPKFSALISQCGEQCLIEAVKGCDVAVIATRGIVALDAVLYCIDNGIDVALANKETLVCAGALVKEHLKNSKSRILPVDSEHCAVWQSLDGRNKPAKILLTASGGAFWGKDKSQLDRVTAQQALKHPNWNMGYKITIDSATMMNKALEVVEAKWLFDVDVNNIEILVNRQSIVHSMVQYNDGSTIAQLASPDMRLPIQYALTYPDRKQCNIPPVQWDNLTLTFNKPDFDNFPCAKLGHEMMSMGCLMPTVINATNDVCVDAFVDGKLKFNDFYNTIMNVAEHFKAEVEKMPLTVQNIKTVDTKVKKFTKNILYGE